MKMKQIVLEITKREGKKRQVNVAQVKEIVSIVSELILDPDTLASLIKNGVRRKK